MYSRNREGSHRHNQNILGTQDSPAVAQRNHYCKDYSCIAVAGTVDMADSRYSSIVAAVVERDNYS